MTPAATKKRSLSTAEERREAVLAAALRVFAARGIHGTPTIEVAKAAGISQAYLFRLFPTKLDLALAALQRCNDLIYDAFAAAAAHAKASGEDVLDAAGAAYAPLLAEHPELLAVLLHGFAAAHDDPQVRRAMGSCFGRLVDLLREQSGAPEEDVRGFFANGMLITVMASLGAFELDEPWARILTADDKDG